MKTRVELCGETGSALRQLLQTAASLVAVVVVVVVVVVGNFHEHGHPGAVSHFGSRLLTAPTCLSVSVVSGTCLSHLPSYNHNSGHHEARLLDGDDADHDMDDGDKDGA